MKRFTVISLFILALLPGCSFEKLYQMKQRHKVYALEQIDLKSMVDRYINKNQTSVATIEGIYSVSSVVTKKGKGIFSGEEKEKVTDREENYSKVAVIRDYANTNRDFIEIVLDKELQPSFSIIGEFTALSGSNLLVYKHFESRGKSATYTFSYDKSRDILEGIRTENNNGFTITYKLTYLKLSPKSQSAINN